MKEYYLKTEVPFDSPDDLRQSIIDEMKASLPKGAEFRGSIGLSVMPGISAGTTVAIIYTLEES